MSRCRRTSGRGAHRPRRPLRHPRPRERPRPRRRDARPARGPELYTRETVLDQLGLYARYGVTTVVSLGGDRDEGFRLRDEQATATLDRSRLYVAGPVVGATTPEAARAQVATLAPRKPDFVKIRVDDNLGTTPKMTPAVYRAVIEEAHRRGLRVAVHIFYLEDARDLLGSGARYREALKVASHNLKALVGAGVPIAFGTDGTHRPKAWADFLVLRSDPLADTRNTHSLESVWIAGNRVPSRDY